MRYISWKDLSERLGVSTSTAKRIQKTDTDFPRRVRISAQRVGFIESEVESYLASLAEREAA